jgi:uncharacterized membrane protein YfcA
MALTLSPRKYFKGKFCLRRLNRSCKALQNLFWLYKNIIDRDTVLSQVLGVVLILFSIYFWYFNKKIYLRPTLPTQIGTGMISGLMGGFFNMQGPPAALYFISTTKDKNQYMAMAQIYMLSGNIMMALVRTYNGFMTTTVGIDYLYGIGGVAIGTTLGGYIFRHLTNGIFKYVVYTYIGISGLVILLTVGTKSVKEVCAPLGC